MTKNEFLTKLKEALENDLDGYAVQENLAYYNSYIDEEVGRGRSEEEVLDELGDPWVIAQSVIGMTEHRLSADEEYDRDGTSGSYWTGGTGRDRYSDVKVHTFTADSWWKRLLVILGIIGIVMVVFAVIGGLISLVMPVVVPVLLIVILVRILRRLR